MADRARLLIHAALFVASIALFSKADIVCDLRVNIRRLTKRSVKTSTTIAYYKLSTFDVTAGTGRFNGSLVEPLVAEYEQQIPFGVLASTYNFVTNSQFSVTFQSPSCPESSSQCDSYLLPGGTYLMYPSVRNSSVYQPHGHHPRCARDSD